MTDKAFLRGFLSSNWVVGETDPVCQHYLLGDQHGETGSDGHAVKAVHNKTGEIRAVKVMDKDGWKKEDFTAHRQEVKLLKLAKHPNIVEVFDVYESQETLYICMEFLGGGELYDRINDSPKGRFTEKECAAVIRDAVAGLKDLHSKNIVHRDLKPGNFLCAASSSLLPIKIIDLGYAKQCPPGKYLNAVVGTPYFIAPEVLKQAYTTQADIWSVGALLFVCAFGYPPYNCDDIDSPEMRKQRETAFDPVPRAGKGPWIPNDIAVSEKLMKLLGAMLALEPNSRPSAAAVLENEWVVDYARQYDEEKKQDRKSGSGKKNKDRKKDKDKHSRKGGSRKGSSRKLKDKHNDKDDKDKDKDDNGMMRMLSKGGTVLLKSTDLPPTHKTTRKSKKLSTSFSSKKVSLGVKMEESGEEEGIVVSVLKRNHPCQLAGLQEGDLVLRVNGAAVNSVPAFADIAKGFPAKPLSFNVMRDGAVVRISVSASDIRKRSRSRSRSASRERSEDNYSSDDYKSSNFN